MEGIILIVLMGICFAVWRNMAERPGLVFCGGSDEDMKIAPGSFSAKTPDGEGAAEAAAKEFLEQKRSGNIQQARELGEAYARQMLENNRELFGNGALVQDAVDNKQHQKILLYAYAANRVIAESAPNSILGQTALNVFYKELEETAPQLYQHVCDMAGYSLYILCERSTSRSDGGIGEVYASLCGLEGDAAAIAEGNAQYRAYYAACDEMLREVRFTE